MGFFPIGVMGRFAKASHYRLCPPAGATGKYQALGFKKQG
jgi:hypothetical protein